MCLAVAFSTKIRFILYIAVLVLFFEAKVIYLLMLVSDESCITIYFATRTTVLEVRLSTV